MSRTALAAALGLALAGPAAADSRTTVRNSGNGSGNHVVIDNGPGRTTVIDNRANGFGNRIVVTGGGAVVDRSGLQLPWADLGCPDWVAKVIADALALARAVPPAAYPQHPAARRWADDDWDW